jgi:predicted anti-sigma-YlaC factor YlaD
MATDTLNCKEASRLLSLAQDLELPAPERARLRVHVALCEACRNVEQQFDFLRRAMRRLGSDERAATDDGASPPKA